MVRLYISYLLLSLLLLSCGFFKQHSTPKQKISGVKYEDKYFEISVHSFKHKNQTHKQLTGRLKDGAGETVTQYHISDICGCVSKVIGPKEQYKLATQLQFDIPLTEEDKFVFKEFSNFPQIGDYCSKSLLDSAKGFIKLQKNKKPSR